MDWYIELKLEKDAYNSHYTTGLTFYDSETTKNLKEVSRDDGKAVYDGPRGSRAVLYTEKKGDVTVVRTEFTAGEEEETLEMISSVALRGVVCDRVHRLRSFWSAEGRLVTHKLTDLGLEPSWCDNGVRVEKFGTRGSLPVREYFPFVVLEDSRTGTFTAVKLYAPATWQMELISQKKADGLVVTGGLGDMDFGHWRKRLSPGETFTTGRALVATGKSLLEVCDKLIKAETPDISPADGDMGILFNEYCTTWGNPTHENIVKIADRLEGKGFHFMVIDCGWYAKGDGWWNTIGDWEPVPSMFPQGLKATADYIRAKGMIPGIWFELENVGSTAKAFHMTDHLLKRNGQVLTVENRRFWDMTDPWVIDYLSERVIGLLKECGFGYIKVDYNESIGVGCDGCESPGEGLRKRISGTQEFFRRIRKAIPDIVIENCASGGHRLEPSMMELVSEASFSDAHECASIPVIAANLHRAIRPDQSQIWAVIRKEDTSERLTYSLANTFLGRMCLSGDILELTEAQWDTILSGMNAYRAAAEIIKHGTTTVLTQTVDSYNDLTGNQLLVREYENRAMAVAHRFGNSEAADFSCMEGWKETLRYGNASGDFTAEVRLYEK